MRRRISPVRLRATPSGLTMTRVSSVCSMGVVMGCLLQVDRCGFGMSGQVVAPRAVDLAAAHEAPDPERGEAGADDVHDGIQQAERDQREPGSPSRARRRPASAAARSSTRITTIERRSPAERDSGRQRLEPEQHEGHEEQEDRLEQQHDREQALGHAAAAARTRARASGSSSASLGLRLSVAHFQPSARRGPSPRRPG